MFTASHARRMVQKNKEDGFVTSVLSPRTAPVIKHGAGAHGPMRRTTIGNEKHGAAGSMGEKAVRLGASTSSSSSGPRMREVQSVANLKGSGGSWR